MPTPAVIDIPSNTIPYYFVVGGPVPLHLVTREERAVAREAAEAFEEVEEELPEGSIEFQVTRFALRDAVSEPGHLELDLVAGTIAEIPIAAVIGKPAMFGWACGTELDRTFRYYHGIVIRFSETGGDYGSLKYRAVVAPRMWRLGLRTRSRIFQNKSVPDIVKQVLQEGGLSSGSDVKMQLSGSYDPRTYCVQYRESDLNFISRLLEEEGMHYFFDHTETLDVLNIMDAPETHVPSVPYDAIVVQARHRSLDSEVLDEAGNAIRELAPEVEGLGIDGLEERLESFRLTYSLQPGKVHLRDYDFENSEHKPAGQAVGAAVAEPEVYDFPGLIDTDATGKKLAEVRMQELDSQILIGHGAGIYRSLAAGKNFAILDHPQLSYNRAYLCTEVIHRGTQEGIVDAEGRPVGMGGTTYENDFECIPNDVAYRPPRVTPKPVIIGVQTAKVVGPGGEEIYTDEFLRVKVLFHWDLEGGEDENASCWLRVVQPWADKNFGTVILPRIGTEVLVEFLEGDPDRPIVNGVVYNDQHMPPFSQPGKKMQTGIKSNTTPGGGGSNELRFDDSSGAEEVYIHAQKDQNNEVENDETTWVGHDRTEKVDNNETITIGVDRTEDVGSNETITIGANRTEQVGANEDITIGANRTENVAANETITIGANRTENVGANESITVAQTRTRNVGIAETINIGAAQAINVGAAQSTTVGAVQANTIGASQTNTIGASRTTSVGGGDKTTVSGAKGTSVGADYAISVGEDYGVKAGKNMVIDAADQITIKCGKSQIVMKKDGDIEIKGKKIFVKGSGDVVLKGSKILHN